MSNPTPTGNEFPIEIKPGYWGKVTQSNMQKAKAEFKERSIQRFMGMGFTREQAILKHYEHERRFRR